jgi:NADH-quinone oxidoreductase subunit L
MHHAQDLKDMGGLREKMPVTFWTFVISTLALAGVPLTSGFLSKDAILLQALHEHRYVLFVLGFGVAFLTAFYMTRLVWLCFMGQPKNREKFEHAHESPLVMIAPLVILAAFTPWLLWGGFAADFFGTPAYYDAHPDFEHVQAAYIAPGGHAPHHDHPWYFQLLAYTTGGLGLVLGVALFRSGRRDEKSRLLPGPLHDLSAAKFHMDEMYLDGVVAAGNSLSEKSAWIDAKVVDGAVNVSGAVSLFVGDVSGDADQVIVDGAVNLAADAAEGAGAAVATAQSGRIRNYLAAAIGVTAVAVVLIVFVLS